MELQSKKPIHGYEWHPMRKYPRNALCPCKKNIKAEKKLKFKKCCGPQFDLACIKEKEYSNVRAFVNSARNLWREGELNGTVLNVGN